MMLRALARQRFAPLRGEVSGARPSSSTIVDLLWFIAVVVAATFAAWKMIDFVAAEVGWDDVLEAVKLGLFTLTRVVVLIAIASLIWVPIGVEVGLRPKLAEKVQPLAQFLAAFPPTCCFPCLSWPLSVST